MKCTADLKLDDNCTAVGKRGALGYVFNDSVKRFEDNTYIVTTSVLNFDTYAKDGFIETKNTIYNIIK